jgi:endonuclease/exonuclease/phosphatase (EEP) superfamily protein YafD
MMWRIRSLSTFRLSLAAIAAAAIVFNIAAFGLGAAIPAFDLLSSAAPVILVAGIAAGLAALFDQARLIAVAALLGGAAPPVVVVAPELIAAARPSAPQSSNRLKVVSLNILSVNKDPAQAISFLLSERPDLVLLQEAARNDHPSFYAILETAYPTIVSNYPHCSTAIATRLPLIEHRHAEFCESVIARLGLPASLGGGELVAASVHLPNARHGEPGSDADVLRTRMLTWRPAIVGGDFNATPWSWGMRRFDGVAGFDRWTRALPTWPAPAAFLPIDHILSTTDWRPIRVRRGPDIGSDHYPIIVELGRRATPR